MNEKSQFLKALFKNPLGVGAIAPSSSELAALMVEGVKAGEDAVVLELGVGTGAITAAISDVLPNNSSYLGVEIDQKLVEIVQNKFPQLHIINGDAGKAGEIYNQHKLGKVSYVISGIPFVSLPKEMCENIFGEIGKFMEKGCLFRTFQYVHGYYTPPAKRLRDYMNERYGPMEKSRVVFKNLPPAFTLTWRTT